MGILDFWHEYLNSTTSFPRYFTPQNFVEENSVKSLRLRGKIIWKINSNEGRNTSINVTDYERETVSAIEKELQQRGWGTEYIEEHGDCRSDDCSWLLVKKIAVCPAVANKAEEICPTVPNKIEQHRNSTQWTFFSGGFLTGIVFYWVKCK